MSDNKVLNINDCWVELKKVTPRAIRLAIQKGKYISRLKGQSYQLLLSSLEKDVQERFLNEYHQSLLEPEKPLVVIQPKQEEVIPEKAKQLALAKYDLVQLWLKFRKEQPPSKETNSIFIELYNTTQYAPELYNVVGKVTIGWLYRWKRQLSGSNDYTKLISNYHYSNNLNYRTILTEQEKQLLLKVLLAPNAYSIGKVISMIKYIFQRQGVEQIPSDITFIRYTDWLKKHNYDKWVLARYGEKALKDKVETFLARDLNLLYVGQVLVADGHYKLIGKFKTRKFV